jgi:hypothetical protein
MTHHCPLEYAGLQFGKYDIESGCGEDCLIEADCIEATEQNESEDENIFESYCNFGLKNKLEECVDFCESFNDCKLKIEGASKKESENESEEKPNEESKKETENNIQIIEFEIKYKERTNMSDITINFRLPIEKKKYIDKIKNFKEKSDFSVTENIKITYTEVK